MGILTFHMRCFGDAVFSARVT